MISQASLVTTPQTTQPSAAPKGAAEPAEASAFAKLMEGAVSEQPQTSAQPDTPPETAQPEAEEAATVEEHDTATPEGLMAVLEDVIAGLEADGGPITAETVMKALSERLGEGPVASVGELTAVAALDDPALEAAMTSEIKASLQAATPLAQLSMAAAKIPAVDRGPAGAAGKATSLDQKATLGAAPAENASASAGAIPGSGPAAAGPALPGTPEPRAIPGDTTAAPTAGTATASVGRATPAAGTAPSVVSVNASPTGGIAFDPVATGQARGAGANAAAVQTSVGGIPVTDISTPAQPSAILPAQTVAQTAASVAATGAGPTAGAVAPPQGDPALQDTSLPPLPFRGDPLAGQAGRVTAEGALSAAVAKGAGGAVDPAALTNAAAAARENALGAAPAAMTVAATMARIAATAQAGTPGEIGPRDAFAVVGTQTPMPLDLSRMGVMPTAAPQSAPQTPDEQLRSHVIQQIRGATGGGDSSFRFSLSPYGMGEIEIELVRSETGRLQVSMTTESAAVLNVLRQDREQLLEALQSRGIPTDNADLDFQTFDERGQRGDRQTDAVQILDRIDSTDPDPDPVQVQRPTPGSGKLDILT